MIRGMETTGSNSIPLGLIIDLVIGLTRMKVADFHIQMLPALTTTEVITLCVA